MFRLPPCFVLLAAADAKMDGGGERVDIAVVGAGMIGSAAAKHIKLEEEGLRVALIGPGEPAVGGVLGGVWK